MTKVYVVHGWSYSVEKWGEIVSILKKKDIDAKVLKVPGLIYPILKPWKLDDYVLWLERKLKGEKGKVVLAGHSNGGRIVMAFAKKHPEKVLKLILIDSAGVYHDELLVKIKRLVFGIVAKAGKRITALKSLKNLLYEVARESDYNRADKVMKKTMVNLIKSDMNRNFESIKVPTFIIWGENDATTPLVDGELIKSKIKNSKLFVIKNAKHSPQFTNPSEVANIISEHI